MPPVDLETLVCGSDNKIGCEPEPSEPAQQNLSIVIPSDIPAESYLVSKEDEYDWFDRNAAFFDRKGSTKGSDHIPSFVSSSVAISKRYVVSLKSKASIIGFPKQHDSTFDSKFRRNPKPANFNPKFFPKRSRSDNGKLSIVPLSEPGSPKVSCIGRVRSKKDRNRRRKAQLKKEIEIVPVVKVSKSEKKGLWKVLKSALKKRGGRKDQSDVPVTEKAEVVEREVTSERYTEPAPAPELAGLKRFASGRRSDSWASYDVDVEESHTHSPPIDRPSQSESVWSRRGVGPVVEVSVERDWENVGPASV